MSDQSNKENESLNNNNPDSPSIPSEPSKINTFDNKEPINKKISGDVDEMVQNSAKYIAQSTFYSILRAYLSIPFGMISSYLLSRIFLGFIDNWNLFIYSGVFIASAHIVLTYFPPNFDSCLYYKGIEMITFNKQKELKGAIYFGIRIKLIAGGILCLGYLIVVGIIGPSVYGDLLTFLILTQLPFMISDEIISITDNLFEGLRQYKFNALIPIIINIFMSAIYLFLFLTPHQDQMFILIALVITNYLWRIGKLLLTFWLLHKLLGQYKAEHLTWVQIKPLLVYGSVYSYLAFYSSVYTQTTSWFMDQNPQEGYLVYNTICTNVSLQLLSSFTLPAGPILTELQVSGEFDKIKMMFSKIVNFNNVLMGYGVGIATFLYPIYIFYIYPPGYYVVFSLIPYAMLTLFFSNIVIKYREYISITSSQPIIKLVEGLYYAISLILAIIGLIYWGILGFIVSSLIANIFEAVLYWYTGKFYKKVMPLPFMVVFKQAFLLIACLLLTYFSITLGQDFYHFSFILSYLFGTGIFLILFTLGLIFLKIITSEDLDLIDQLKISIPFKKFIIKFLRFFFKSSNRNI